MVCVGKRGNFMPATFLKSPINIRRVCSNVSLFEYNAKYFGQN